MKTILFILSILLLVSKTNAQFPDRAIVPVVATEAYFGGTASGFMRIFYTPGRPTNTALRQPLIVVEGFDPGHITKPEAQFGETSIDGFLADIDDDAPTAPAVATPLQNLLSNNLREYDIVYIDWANGTDYIQRNALLVEQVIRYVNANKVAVGGVMQPNVVLGQSMGGLCARYALRDMENKGQNHQTRLYISWDSPHQGANVPQGMQHMARHARDMYLGTGGTAIAIESFQFLRGGMSPLQVSNMANSPAGKQMLLNWVNDLNVVDNTAHNAWQTELKNFGYPQGVAGIPFRRVAVSNGSECAKPQPFAAGGNLLTVQGKANTSFLGDIAASMALPIVGAMVTQPLVTFLSTLPGRNDFSMDFAINAQANGSSNQVYKGKITYTKKILWLIPVTVVVANRAFNSSASTLPYDYFPGGQYNVPLNLQSSEASNFLSKYNITASNQRVFDFIPTPSALDIGSGNVALTTADYLTPYLGSNPPVGTKASPFHNFITAINGSPDNELHLLIERRNGDWTARELQGISPNDATNCQFLCGNNSISGNEFVCGVSSTYTLPAPPAGSTVSWTGPSWVTITSLNPPVNSQVSVSAGTTSGIATLSATVNIPAGACGFAGGSPPTYTKNINFGAPSAASFNGLLSTDGFAGALLSPGPNCLRTYFHPGFYEGVLNFSDQLATSYTWAFVSKGGHTPASGIHTGTSVSSGSLPVSNVSIYVKPANAWAIYRLTLTNTCGSRTADFRFTANGICYLEEMLVAPPSEEPSAAMLSATPNPASSTAIITLKSGTSAGNALAKALPAAIQEVRIVDKFGTIKRQYSLKGSGSPSAKVNVAGLPKDIYNVMAFDGATWHSVKMLVQ